MREVRVGFINISSAEERERNIGRLDNSSTRRVEYNPRPYLKNRILLLPPLALPKSHHQSITEIKKILSYLHKSQGTCWKGCFSLPVVSSCWRTPFQPLFSTTFSLALSFLQNWSKSINIFLSTEVGIIVRSLHFIEQEQGTQKNRLSYHPSVKRDLGHKERKRLQLKEEGKTTRQRRKQPCCILTRHPI